MSDRAYASVFYIALIVGSSWVVVTVSEALAREALTQLALIPSRDQRPSRVNVVLAAQAHPVSPQTSGEALAPTAPSVPVGALAKALDDAEQAGEQDKAMADMMRPHVAGWMKRLPKRAVSATAHDESAGRIVVRSLRAEM